jgi:RNA polymerase sigma-70 factor (ECF subfamily)
MKTLPEAMRGSWSEFLDTYEPLRTDLYHYCRHLTRSTWDAEDLAQDTLARAFVTLAQMGEPPPNPKAWLFRVASNLWIDQQRRARGAAQASDGSVTTDAREPIATREAAGTLLGQLAPQERAAVVLKDVFDFSLEEVAAAVGTTAGAVKAALHRARGKLMERAPTESSLAAPAPGVLDAFCAAFNAGDLERLTSLLLDSASVEVVGATTIYGPEVARRTVLPGMLFGYTKLGDVLTAPRAEIRNHRGHWILLHWYSHADGEFVRAITTLEGLDERVVRIRNYFYNPNFIEEVCRELEVPFRTNGHRWFSC